jgi:hypothetical protein
MSDLFFAGTCLIGVMMGPITPLVEACIGVGPGVRRSCALFETRTRGTPLGPTELGVRTAPKGGRIGVTGAAWVARIVSLKLGVGGVLPGGGKRHPFGPGEDDKDASLPGRGELARF